MKNFFEYVSPWKAPPADPADDATTSDSENDATAAALNFNSPAESVSKSPTRKRRRVPTKKATPAKKARKPVAAKKPVAKKPAAKAAAKPAVKRERLRRSARSTGYKKGSYSQKNMERQAWRGTGSQADPIQL